MVWPWKIKRFWQSGFRRRMVTLLFIFLSIGILFITFLDRSALQVKWPFVLIFMFFVIPLFSYILERTFTKPLRGLLNATNEISKGLISKDKSLEAEDELGELTRGFSEMATRLEEYYRQIDEKIKTQQKYLINILNDSADGIVSLDEHDRVITWNRGAELIYGYKAEEIVGKSFEVLVPDSLIAQGEPDKMKRILTEKGVLRHYETERLRKDGKKIIVDITKTVMKNDEGKVVGSSAIVKDITERKELEKRLLQTEKLTITGQIAANIAHEIKNPLMGISGSVQVLMKKTEDNPVVRITLEKIFEQVQRLDSTLKGLLSFSRPQTPYFSKGDINEVIDQILFFMAPEAKKRNIEIVRMLSENLPHTSFDPDQIKQVFLNIILNAIQAMPDGGNLCIQTYSGNGNKESVTVKISDTGIGIDEEIREEIFKPFFTTKTKGTGLGLVISSNIVKEHGGEITFESDPGKGSVFQISLPLEQ